MGLMFPIYVAEKGKELPKEGTYYLITKSGFFLHKDTGIIQALVAVDEIPMLCDVESYVQLRLPKLPPDICYRAWKFFNAVYKKFNSESAVVIHFNVKEQEYYLHCPDQEVSHGSVHYSLDDRFQDFQLVGTIHSHCDFDAFHSGTDVEDETGQDGVHITLGHVNSEYFSASACLVVNATRFETSLENTAQGVRVVTMKNTNPNIIAGRGGRYMVSLSNEEKGVIDAAYDEDIQEWLRTKVNRRQGFHSVYKKPDAPSTSSNGSGGGTITAGGTQRSTTSFSAAKPEHTYTYRLDPAGSNRMGWFNDTGEELNPADTGAKPAESNGSTQTESSDSAAPASENWDADAVLAQNDLLGSEVAASAADFSETAYKADKGQDQDLIDLTVVDDAVSGGDNAPDSELGLSQPIK